MGPTRRGDKSEKGKATAGSANGNDSLSPTPRIEEAVDSANSRPASRQARVEEVPDEVREHRCCVVCAA